MPIADPKAFFVSLYDAAVRAADPAAVISAHLPEKPKGRTVVIGAGKGSAQLAQAFERAWDGPLSGVVVTRYGFGVPCKHFHVHEASHPVPDAAGLEGSRLLFAAVKDLGPDDLVVALISGGGSALLPSPPDGMTLADEIAVNEALLASGAPITAMNAVRKHLSTIKGGRLAAACHPARVVTLAVSDIPGDKPAFIASGPTVPDATSKRDALDVVKAWSLALPKAAQAYLQSSAADAPMPDDPVFANNHVAVIASAGLSLEAAAETARRGGIEAVILSDAIEGEAREIARMHGAMALEIARRDRPFAKPVVLLSGGETTVTLRGKGKGGRNTEFLLSLALTIQDGTAIHAFAADTDGIDGSEDNAGAFCDGTTVARLRDLGHDARAMLTDNDAWSAFHALGDLFVPGPSGTNVNDLRAVLIQ